MLEMKTRRILIRARDRKQLGLLEQSAQECEGYWCSIISEAVRKNYRRVAGEVCRHQLGEIRRTGRRDNHVHRIHQLVPLLDRDGAKPVRIHVIDRGNEPGSSE